MTTAELTPAAAPTPAARAAPPSPDVEALRADVAQQHAELAQLRGYVAELASLLEMQGPNANARRAAQRIGQRMRGEPVTSIF